MVFLWLVKNPIFIPGWTVASEGKTTVALDLTITDELKSEGIAREFINRVQDLRKDKDFDLTDRISIILEESGPYKQELINNERYICEEVLSDKIEFVNSLPISEEIEIDEVKFKVNVMQLKFVDIGLRESIGNTTIKMWF